MEERERMEREERIALCLLGLGVSLLFLLPLLAAPVARSFGWHVFFLSDSYIQLFWATIVQLWPGWLLYRGCWASLGRRQLSPALLVAPLSLGAYGYSLAATVGGVAYSAGYLASVGLISLYLLGMTLAAFIGFQRRSTPNT